MADDLVGLIVQLRDVASDPSLGSRSVCEEAATAIERLRDEINILKSQLEHDAAVIERLQAELDNK